MITQIIWYTYASQGPNVLNHVFRLFAAVSTFNVFPISNQWTLFLLNVGMQQFVFITQYSMFI